MLDGHNPFEMKIPYILLTNGGGVSEVERCKKLSRQLEVPIDPNQYIQAHTILKTFSHKYSDKAVLVLGGELDAVRNVAQSYGFKNAYTTIDVLAWNRSVWPFHAITEAESEIANRVDFSRTRISAIFVFHDPRNWALDVQVLCDVIQSDGVIGGPYLSSEERLKEPVEVVFCNPDLLWRSDFERPRLGQGAFKEAFQAVYKASYGKPTMATYNFAETVLTERLKEVYGVAGTFSNIYMVGDNPQSDIAGANAAGWSSILVRTGVFDPQQGPPSHHPTHVANDVEAAVKWAIDRELARGV
ncbi:hypothetical protein J132_04330 [Termitomyces sp. J132]|nr:hypothetical protein J132_04330 [Termitomyces sp. J132]